VHEGESFLCRCGALGQFVPETARLYGRTEAERDEREKSKAKRSP
jgi:hypothetical protein